MKRQRILPWALALLDDGLRLYRRHFLSFLMVAAVVMVPFHLLALFLTGFVRTQLGEDWTGLGLLLISLVQYPIVLYACLALSRAAARALDDTPVRLGQVLRIGPVRAVGMGCHGLLLSAITGTFSGIVVISVACPLLYASVFGASILGAVGGSAGPSGAVISMLTLVVSVSFLATLLLTSSTFASLAYAVQAFALEDRAVGSSITRSIDLLLFRFGRSILVFVGAGAIIGTLLIAYLGTLFAGGYALLDWLDIELSPIAQQALSGVASAATWVVLLPPLAIWMAMLHRSLAQERDAPELIAAVETWRSRIRNE